ncbi:MAG: hypothetical protein HDQ88_10815 [Clostridia bacterium]|nr:hypothetical protein [Clostridia bacterium]
MSVYTKPVVLADDGKHHAPAIDGSKISPDYLPVSAVAGNALTVKEDGLAVAPVDMVSPQEGNALVENVDGKLIVKAENLVGDNEKMLSAVDNKIVSNISLEVSQDKNTLSILGKDGAVLATTRLPGIPGILLVGEVLYDYQPPDPEGYEAPTRPRGTYIHLRFRLDDGNPVDYYINASGLVDTYTAGDGIIVQDNVVSVKPVIGGGINATPDGVMVQVPDLVSTAERNALVADASGKLYVGAGFSEANLGEGLIIGPDGKLRIDLAALIDPTSALIVTPAGKLGIDQTKLAVGVSSDEGNILTEGSDGKAYFPGDLGNI